MGTVEFERCLWGYRTLAFTAEVFTPGHDDTAHRPDRIWRGFPVTQYPLFATLRETLGATLAHSTHM